VDRSIEEWGRLALILGEFLNPWKKLEIGRRKSIERQVLGLHPSKVGTTQRSRRALHPVTLKEVQGDGLGLIIVIRSKHLFDGLHLQGQLFPHLSFKTGFQALSGLLLAAREFPIPCKMSALRPPRDQELATFPDQACGDMKMGFTHGGY